jgi:tungstate transport system ATP-binding protein
MTASAVAMPVSSSTLVTLQDCGVTFERTQALRDVSLQIVQGERIAVVGSNGSGKTTLLRLLHGLVDCSSGRCDRPVSPQGQPWRQAMLFQRPFVLSLSARFNVQLASAGRKRWLHWTAWVYCPRLSSAQQRCLAGNCNVWPWPVRGRCARNCCCWTSPPPAWTQRPSAKWSP